MSDHLSVGGPIAYLGLPTVDHRQLDSLDLDLTRGELPVMAHLLDLFRVEKVGLLIKVQVRPTSSNGVAVVIGTMEVEGDIWMELTRLPVRAHIDVDMIQPAAPEVGWPNLAPIDVFKMEGRLMGLHLSNNTGPIWEPDTIIKPIPATRSTNQ